MILLLLAVLAILFVAWWFLPSSPGGAWCCGYKKTPPLARPAMHHIPFRYPKDTNNSDQPNQVYFLETR